MKKIVITGAAGFLGSHLVKSLSGESCLVIGLDNLSSGTMANIYSLENCKNFKFVECDVTSWARLAELPELRQADEIYHLASPASPKFYAAAPFDTIAVNTVGTRNMLELARAGGARFVFTSTSEAYGDPDVHPQVEEYRGNVSTWGPRACYDEAKRLGEVYCYEYWQRFGVKVKVARVFNTYSAGLRNDDGRVISNFVNQALLGEPITVFGNGSQTRSFCYVDDTVRGLRLMMEKEEADGQIINIGNPEEYTVLEVAEKVKDITKSESPITFHPLPADDPKRRKPDISKARAMLGWSPLIGLDEGLKRTIDAYRRQVNPT